MSFALGMLTQKVDVRAPVEKFAAKIESPF